MKPICTSITASGLLAALAIAQPTPRYTVKDLGTLDGAGTTSSATQMNYAGWVAGFSNLTEGGPQHSFLWYGTGKLRDLGTLDGDACPDCNSAADGPNAYGEVAIGSETSVFDPNGEDFCGFGTHRQCLPAIWKQGALQALPTLPGGQNANAFGVNNAGEVVGFSENGKPDSTCLTGGTPFQVIQFEAVKWGPGGAIRKLSPYGSDKVAFAFGINDNGQAVGASGLCANTAVPPNPAGAHAVLWDSDGTPHNLGNLPGMPDGAFNVASTINNRGDVGGGALSTDGTIHAFRWTSATGMQDFGAFPGAFLTTMPCCHTINDRGQMVGFAIDATTFNFTALIWNGNVPVDLNKLIPSNSGWSLQAASSINNAGEITGYGLINGNVHAFVAVPK